MAAPPEDDFKTLQTRLYEVTKQKLTAELEQLDKGEHPEHKAKEKQFKIEKEQTIKGAGAWFQFQMQDVQGEYDEEVERIEKETEEKLGKLEKKLRGELEAFKQELSEEKSQGDARAELMRDIDTSTRTLRTQGERRRKRLYGEGIDDHEILTSSSHRSGGGKKRNVGGKKSAAPAPAMFSVKKCLSMQLPDWEVDQDIKILKKLPTSSSRRTKPPNKFANGAPNSGRGRR